MIEPHEDPENRARRIGKRARRALRPLRTNCALKTLEALQTLRALKTLAPGFTPRTSGAGETSGTDRPHDAVLASGHELFPIHGAVQPRLMVRKRRNCLLGTPA